MIKDKYFLPTTTIDLNGILLDLSTTHVMGILNITTDSFYDGGKHNNTIKALQKVEQFIKEGASIVDIGAYSSRPGAKHISTNEEWKRLKKIIPIVNKEFPEIIISIDTFRANIAQNSIENGAHIINDISAGEMDSKMFDTIAKLQVPYIMMHMQGTPQNMQENPQYSCIEKEVFCYFKNKLKILKKKGVKKIIIDPGFGFGKSLEHNYQLLNNLELLHDLKLPILAGVSRKSMIYKLLESTPAEALNGTTAIHTVCLQKGVSILRVHDVKEAVECTKIINFAQNHQ
tara:strand:+ start:732 stop:1592 length:861 start_codon:yes stop_codon:yes gene_type:complete